MDLEFTRGDSKSFKITLLDKNGENIILKDEDKLYITVKKNSRDKNIIFQKTLRNGIVNNNDGTYTVNILPNDTSNLDYGNYGYDIELKTGNFVKTLGVFSITLTEEYTHVGDEV